MGNEYGVFSDCMRDFLTALRDSENSLRFAEEELKRANDVINDVLHKLELCKLTSNEQRKLARIIATTRKKRRKAKNEIEKLKPLVEWSHNRLNSEAMKTLRIVLGETRKIEERAKTCIYVPRTDVVNFEKSDRIYIRKGATE